MKKLLSIFSSFGIVMSSSLSIIACKNANKQTAIEQLKDQTIKLTVADGKEETVKNAIENSSDFKSKLADTSIKIESFAFKKNNTNFQDTFVNREEYEVTLKLKIEDNNQETIGEGTAIFKITIIFSTIQQDKVETIVSQLQTIDEEIIELESTDLTVAKLTEAIKNLQKYKDIFKDGVTLEGSFTLKKADTDVTTFADSDIITVKGKVKTEDKIKDFIFTVKVDVLTNQEKIDKAEVLLQKINQKIIKVVTADLSNVVKIKDAIKNLQEYKNVVKDRVTLEEDLTLLKGSPAIAVTTVTHNDVITVKGKIAIGTGTDKKERNFRFTVKVDIYTDQQKVNIVQSTLQEINEQVIKVSTVDLSNMAKIKDVIKDLQNYKEAFEDGVILEGDLTLLKGSSAIAVTTVTHNDVITVEGKLKAGTEEKPFTFNVKIDEFTNQEKVDKAIILLQRNVQKTIELPTADLANPIESIKNEITNLQEVKEVFKDGVIIEGDLTLKKGNDAPITSVAHGNDITVEGKLKAGTEEKPFTFNVKVDELTDQEKVDKALKLLQEIDNVLLEVATADLANPVEPLKDKIKKILEFKDVLKDGVTLEGDLILKKAGANFTTVADDNEIIVQGKLKAGTEEKPFTFNAWIDELTNQKKVRKTVDQLQEIDGEIISLAASDLNIAKLEAAIKNLQEYQDAFEDKVTLKKIILF